MKIAIFQKSSIELNDPQFITCCEKLSKHTLIVFGEYVLNPFFQTLKELSHQEVVKNTQAQLVWLEEIAKKKSLSFIAPVIMPNGKKLIKQIVFINGFNKKTSMLFYTQQKLINYDHWNEADFFANPKLKNFKNPMLFEYEGVRMAALFGFEIHFDEIWLKIKNFGVDIVVLCSANTFDSSQRWRELCKMRSFLNGCVIVRVNRVGETIIDEENWKFYGDSFVVMPNGEIIDNLGAKDEMLFLEIGREKIVAMALEWGFRSNYNILTNG